MTAAKKPPAKKAPAKRSTGKAVRKAATGNLPARKLAASVTPGDSERRQKNGKRIPSRPAKLSINEYGLTPIEERFATFVALGVNQSEALRRADPGTAQWTEKTVHSKAYEIAAKPAVQGRIAQLLDEAAKNNAADVEFVLKHYLQQAKADPRELSSVQVSACRRCWGKNHRYQHTDGELADKRAVHEEKNAARAEEGKPPLPPLNEGGGGGYSATLKPNPECPTCGGAGESRVVLHDSRGYSAGALSLFEAAEETKDGRRVKAVARNDAWAAIARHVGFFGEQAGPTEDSGPSPEDLDALYDRKMSVALERDAEALRRRAEQSSRLDAEAAPGAEAADGE